MTTRLIPSNVAQKIPTFDVNGRVVIQPETWYTCPTGKKAICKGRVQCTSRGAAAISTFTIAGIIMFQWVRSTAVVDTWENGPRNLTTQSGGQLAFFEVELAAGDTVVTSQDSGTNAEFNLWMEVQETPI